MSTVDTTSYDYDAPLTENGDWTEKYNMTREIVSEFFPDYVPKNFVFKRPAMQKYAPIGAKKIFPRISLFEMIKQNREVLRELNYIFDSEDPISMEFFPGKWGAFPVNSKS